MNKKITEYSIFQRFIFLLIAMLMSQFITLLTLDKNTFLKIVLFIFSTFLVYKIVVLMARNLSRLCHYSVWISVIHTAVILLLIPTIMVIMYFRHINSFLTDIPANNIVPFRISWDSNRIDSSGRIGNEWCYKHTINDIAFSGLDVVEIDISKPFTIKSTIIEKDMISDVGKATSKPHNFTRTGNFIEDVTVTNTITVKEYGGRNNRGAYATFLITYTITREIPSDYSFFDVYFYSSHTTLLWIILIIGAAYVVYAICVICIGELQTYKKEKLAFISKLGNMSLRDFAGVPSHIKYSEGRPTDNNNNAIYGSFTVYLSRTGRCYHKVKGCCNAHQPTHVIPANRQYKPCAWCGARYCTIPEWHTRYIALRKEARKYGIKG